MALPFSSGPVLVAVLFTAVPVSGLAQPRGAVGHGMIAGTGQQWIMKSIIGKGF